MREVGPNFLQQRADHPLGVGQQRGQQVQGLQLRMFAIDRQSLSGLDRLLGLDGELVESECHGSAPGNCRGTGPDAERKTEAKTNTSTDTRPNSRGAVIVPLWRNRRAGKCPLGAARGRCRRPGRPLTNSTRAGAAPVDECRPTPDWHQPPGSSSVWQIACQHLVAFPAVRSGG